MSYIRSLLAHFRVLQDWAVRAHATAELDVRSFELELRCRGRYWDLAPQFAAVVDGRLVYQPMLTADAAGFSGWLPYRPRPWTFAADKIAFKGWLRAAGLQTPDWWDAQPGFRPDAAYLVKGSPGSFGAEVTGPFRAGEPVPSLPAGEGDSRRWFVESFIEGRILKAWYWGGRACFAHVHELPRLRGDGLRTARELALERLAGAGRREEGERPLQAVAACLAWQRLGLQDVVARDARPFIDFRYGHRYDPLPGRLASDDALPALAPGVREQVDAFGSQVAERLRQDQPAPMLFAGDAVLDGRDRLWWLELNANPAVPPEAYAPMLEDLFGFRPQAAPAASAALAPA